MAEEALAGKLATATAARDAAEAAHQAAVAAVEAAQRELAGAEAGDGRDQSNKSLQERLADAQNAQASMLCLYKNWASRQFVCMYQQ